MCALACRVHAMLTGMSFSGYHFRIDAEDPMGQLQTQKLEPVHSYQSAKYGPGVGVLSLRQVQMDDVVCESKCQES